MPRRRPSIYTSRPAMQRIGAGIADSIMPAIGRCTSYGPLNTNRITSAADMTTIMAAVTIEATITVMDTTAIGTTIMSGTMITIDATIAIGTMTVIDTTTVSETLFASAV
jgi:hypothetical protein